jgi:hypothetical protein
MFTFSRQTAIVSKKTRYRPDKNDLTLRIAPGDTMKNLLTVSALLLLVSGTALAGSGYDGCIKEEKALRTLEASECSGLRQLLNPSACYGTQKALKEYKAGKCRQIGTAENVDFNAPAVTPGKKSGSPGDTSKTGDAGSVSTTVGTGNVGIVAVKKVESEAPQQEGTLEQLKEENARLKAEISRLKTENEQLRKAGQ